MSHGRLLYVVATPGRPGYGTPFRSPAGDRAVEFASQDHVDIFTAILPKLNNMFTENISAAYGRLLQASDVIDYKVAAWSTDPLFYGSYTVGETGYLQNDYAEISRRRGNLIFSGEATCQNHFGYVHGALFAGDTSARTILSERYGRSDIATASFCTSTVEKINAIGTIEPITEAPQPTLPPTSQYSAATSTIARVGLSALLVLSLLAGKN